MKVSKFQFAILALIVVTVVYVAAFAGAWHYVHTSGFTWKKIYAVGTVIFCMWYAVACYSVVKKNRSEAIQSKLTRLRVAATILTIIGGVAPALSGGHYWMYSQLTGISYPRFFPVFGFISFALGMLIILGGVLISRGRLILGGNLAIWCGIAGIFGGGGIAAMQALTRFFPGLVAGVLGLILTIFFPVLGGVLGLMSRAESK